MNYNFEDLFKQKMLNHTLTPPKSVWNGINFKLLNIYKYLAAFSFVAITIILSVFFITPKNQEITPLKKPITSNTKITSGKHTIAYTDVNLAKPININAQTPGKNVIIATTNTKKVTLQKDTILNNTQKNSTVDTTFDYQGFTLTSTTGCVPLTIVLENIEKSNNLTWNINNITIHDTGKVIVTLIEPNSYQIILSRNDNGTINTFTENVVVNPQPIADFSINQQIVANEDVIFENLSSDATKYFWFINNQLISSSENTIHKFNIPGTYKITLIVSNEFDCSDTIQKNIEVIEPLKHIVCPTAFVPNIFGSSGGFYSNTKNENEIFHPFVFGKEVSEYSMKIFNRKGILMFQSIDLEIGWDGYFQNELVPIGVYIYSIKGTFTDGQTFAEQGSVTVLYNN